MSSIAYISDEKMIEFHRLYSHDEINFWRLSTREFSDFTKNDFLFFLVKTPLRKEKGIVGFGKLNEMQDLSVRQMWNRFGTKNGYHTYESLHEAIASANKQEKLPKKCSCLTLKEVVFFEAPLYLSDFGFKLHDNLESFTYIDTHQDTTSKILEAAIDIGRDLWSITTGTLSRVSFEEELLRHQISEKLKHFKLFGDPRHQRLSRQFDSNLQLPVSPYVFFENKTLYLPCLLMSDKHVLSVYGLVSYLMDEFEQLNGNIIAYTDKKISPKVRDLFTSRTVRLVHVDELVAPVQT